MDAHYPEPKVRPNFCFVLCAEPRELTIVSVVGTLDPTELAGLGGHFGIPELDIAAGSAHRWREAK